MKINELLQNNTPFEIYESTDKEIEFTGISYNSSKTKASDMFVAVKGLSSDGHDYIADAVKKGASCIVCETKAKNIDIPQIVVSNSRRALSYFSAAFHGFPSKNINVIGVTGTNGKTTICSIIEAILEKAGKKPGVIGTIDSHFKNKMNEHISIENTTTTPESKDLQEIIHEMKSNGVTHVIMEVSSHAISMKRVEDINFNVLVFSNLTQDHLDFHKTMDEYAKVKSDFIINTALKSNEENQVAAVINADNDCGKKIIKALEKNNAKFIDYSTESKSQLKASNIKASIDKTEFKICGYENEYKISSLLKGHHNIENILAACGAAVFAGVSPDDVFKFVQTVKPVAGRLDQVINPFRPNIFVDYAHTPDALENVLKALRPLCKNRLISIFGCGGDRDSKKRPLMGEISGNLADISIVTSDNPRTEDPNKIIDDIKPGIKAKAQELKKTDNLFKKSKGYIIEADRKKAIEKAIAIAHKDDCILIAGKGHETYQIIGKTKIDFDDKKTVLEAVEKIYG